jgi:hypothetical protein
MESLALRNDHALFILINCAGGDGAANFAAEHNITRCLHFTQERIPADFGVQYVPHKVVVRSDGVVVKNFDFVGTSLAKEVEKLRF